MLCYYDKRQLTKGQNKMSKTDKTTKAPNKKSNKGSILQALGWKAAALAGLAILLGLAVKGASQYLVQMNSGQKLAVASVIVVSLSLVCVTGLSKKLK